MPKTLTLPSTPTPTHIMLLSVKQNVCLQKLTYNIILLSMHLIVCKVIQYSYDVGVQIIISIQFKFYSFMKIRLWSYELVNIFKETYFDNNLCLLIICAQSELFALKRLCSNFFPLFFLNASNSFQKDRNLDIFSLLNKKFSLSVWTISNFAYLFLLSRKKTIIIPILWTKFVISHTSCVIQYVSCTTVSSPTLTLNRRISSLCPQIGRCVTTAKR